MWNPFKSQAEPRLDPRLVRKAEGVETYPTARRIQFYGPMSCHDFVMYELDGVNGFYYRTCLGSSLVLAWLDGELLKFSRAMRFEQSLEEFFI